MEDFNINDLREESRNLRQIIISTNPELEVVINRYIFLIHSGGKEVEDLQEEVKYLKTLVYKDELTGVLNRRGFFDRFSGLFNESFAYKKGTAHARKFELKDLAIIFVDIDDFKKINDEYGHDKGDFVLKKFAEVLQSSIRDEDAIARIGGEEFVIVLLGANEDDAYQKSEEIRENIEKNVGKVFDFNKKITASFGVVSLSGSNAENLEELVTLADKAMYEAKHNRGKNNTARFSEINTP